MRNLRCAGFQIGPFSISTGSVGAGWRWRAHQAFEHAAQQTVFQDKIARILLGHEPQFYAGRSARSYDRRLIDFLTRITVPRAGSAKKPAPAFTDSQIGDIFRENTSRFLGLTADQRANGTRGRLEKSYSDRNLDADWLNSF